MTSKRVATLAKLMADEKVDHILKVAGNPAGLTTKQIAKAVKRPVSQLYYTINKMVDAGLLEIVKQEKVKNLDEYYYSSDKITHDEAESRQLQPDDYGGLNVAPSWTAEHLDDLTQLVLYRNNQFLTAFQNNYADYKTTSMQQHTNDTSFMDTQLHLSPAANQQLWQQIVALIDQAEKNDHGEDKHSVNFLFERWHDESN